MKYGGVPREEALKFVTLNPAKQLRIDRPASARSKPARTPILSSGRAIRWRFTSRCEETWIDGRKYFDRDDDRAATSRTSQDACRADSQDPRFGPGYAAGEPSGSRRNGSCGPGTMKRAMTGMRSIEVIRSLVRNRKPTCNRLIYSGDLEHVMPCNTHLQPLSIAIILVVSSLRATWPNPQVPGPPQKQPLALTNATIHPVSRPGDRKGHACLRRRQDHGAWHGRHHSPATPKPSIWPANTSIRGCLSRSTTSA